MVVARGMGGWSSKPVSKYQIINIVGGRNSLEHSLLATFARQLPPCNDWISSTSKVAAWSNSRWNTNALFMTLSLSSLKVNFFLRIRPGVLKSSFTSITPLHSKSYTFSYLWNFNLCCSWCRHSYLHIASNTVCYGLLFSEPRASR